MLLLPLMMTTLSLGFAQVPRELVVNAEAPAVTGPVQEFPVGTEADCPHVDLRKTYDFGIARNQGSLGWCYAFAMADILSFELKQKVSALDLALSNYREERAYGIDRKERISDLSAGRADWTFRAAKKRGVCAEKNLSASGVESARKLRDIEDLMNTVSKMNRQDKDYLMKVQRLTFQNASLLRKVFPTKPLWDMVKTMQELPANPHPLLPVADQMCAPRTSLADLQFKSLVNNDQEVLISETKKILLNGHPVGWGYSAQTLRKTDYSGPTNHASSIIGMRWNKPKRRCELLLRNSWGSVRQKSYDAEIRKGFEGGHLWVPQDIATRMVRQIYFIERK